MIKRPIQHVHIYQILSNGCLTNSQACLITIMHWLKACQRKKNTDALPVTITLVPVPSTSLSTGIRNCTLHLYNPLWFWCKDFNSRTLEVFVIVWYSICLAGNVSLSFSHFTVMRSPDLLKWQVICAFAPSITLKCRGVCQTDRYGVFFCATAKGKRLEHV